MGMEKIRRKNILVLSSERRNLQVLLLNSAKRILSVPNEIDSMLKNLNR